MRCRSCGCTDYDCRGCIERTGEPCSWAHDRETEEGPLCSACVRIEDVILHGTGEVEPLGILQGEEVVAYWTDEMIADAGCGPTVLDRIMAHVLAKEAGKDPNAPPTLFGLPIVEVDDVFPHRTSLFKDPPIEER